ncbi:MAG: hypothetical protein K0S38_919 [Candidatus Paceibacter sp.]|jgi:hypothetical protein|nr:hypothetical protein [Candidatus Paceibacter sp.]
MRSYKKESELPNGQNRKLLEQYFTDLKILFLKRFALFDLDKKIHEYDTKRLVELLHEMIHIRSLLDKAP